MAAFSKPIVAAVNGTTMGLGVSILPLCDLVLASDKATFYMPYSDIGQSLEGGASLTFPKLSGSLVRKIQIYPRSCTDAVFPQAGDLVYSGRKITAMEAERIGLVSRVIWHDKYNEYLMPTVQELASKSLQVGKPPDSSIIFFFFYILFFNIQLIVSCI
jgi:chromodomain protein Y